LTHPFVKKVIAGFRAYVQSQFFHKEPVKITVHPFIEFYKKFYETGNVAALKIDKSGSHQKGMTLIVEM
jgi:hypothetical protein